MSRSHTWVGLLRRVLIGMLCAIYCSACTVLGAGIGTVASAVTPGPYERVEGPGQDFKTHPIEAAKTLKIGTQIRIILHSGKILEGEYHGWAHEDNEAPRHAQLNIYTEVGPTRVSTREIKALLVERFGDGPAYGALAGLALDAIFLLLTVSALRNAPL